MRQSNSEAIIQVSEFQIASAAAPHETQNKEVSPCRQTIRSTDDITVATSIADTSWLAYSTKRLLAINRIVQESL